MIRLIDVLEICDFTYSRLNYEAKPNRILRLPSINASQVHISLIMQYSHLKILCTLSLVKSNNPV